MAGGAVTNSSLIYGLHKFADQPQKIQEKITAKVDCAELYNRIEPNNEEEIHHATPVYARTTMSYTSDRTKSIQEAKHAFLSSTIRENNKCLPPLAFKDRKAENRLPPPILFENSAVTNKSEDSRITGGGSSDQTRTSTKNQIGDTRRLESKPSFRKNEVQNRKVSFKTKNGSATHLKRSNITGKTTVTITNNKVAELTRKYNEMTIVANEKERDIILNQPQVARTLEKIQNISAHPSNCSTPSSTLSSGNSIKIIVRKKRSLRGKNPRVRCSSADSIDKIVLTESPLLNKKVFRTRSDGNRKQKSPKKRNINVQHKTKDNSDCVDGVPQHLVNSIPHNSNTSNRTSVKNVIKKFEGENQFSNIDVKDEKNLKTLTSKTKPQVPEKKSTVIVTKNVVLKDGVPKIKTIKRINEVNLINTCENKQLDETFPPKKKESLYDTKKYKTNYIHKDQIPLKLVEIIHDDVNTSNNEGNEDDMKTVSEEEKHYQDIAARITPNESFLWRRISNSHNSSEVSIEASPDNTIDHSTPKYETDNIDLNSNDLEIKLPENDLTNSNNESQLLLYSNISKVDCFSDSEINEALNKEVIFKHNIATLAVPEDDYEIFATVDNSTIISVNMQPNGSNTERKSSKFNCPLPDIPKEDSDGDVEIKDNIYQCLLEMRSHPEGDESSIHSYEMFDNQLEERTRGDGDSDDGYEYCKSPNTSTLTKSTFNKTLSDPKPLPPPPVIQSPNHTNYEISKSISTASTISYDRMSTDAIYERISSRPKTLKELPHLPIRTRDSIVSSEYTGYNDGENIYDTIKPPDGSISNCYESIPNSPRGVVKLRNNFRKQISAVQKRLSFDSMSNVSRSTLSSEQKTNSIYGQRSIISFSGQEIAFQVPNSDTSVSDRSDRSEDWVDVSDQEEEKNGESKIIIVRERSRKSPVSWSQKVRHQWQKSPKQTSAEAESSDSSHYYESLNTPEPPAPRSPRPPRPPRSPAPYDDDFDSFDSDSDTEARPPAQNGSGVDLEARLPPPPSSHYTLTKFASAARRAAGNKMRQLTRNFTKRHSDYGKSYSKTSKEETPKSKSKSTYEDVDKSRTPEPNGNKDQRIYSAVQRAEGPVMRLNGNALNEELKEKIIEKRLSLYNTDTLVPQDKPTTPTDPKKDSGTLSRKTYFSFKSRFRRASSMAVDINSDVPSALKITNSTFYLTDSMDGDSGFSNCSDSQVTGGSSETLQPPRPERRERRDRRADSGTRLARQSESTPDLASCDERRRPRPSAPPPPPPHAPATDISAVHAELKRLLPSLSKKEKSPRTRTSWYAGADQESARDQRGASSWYAEVGLYQEGSVSSSSGASSSASPLPHSRFISEPLYQFYNAAKVESVCRENVAADSDSDGYETVRELRAAAVAGAAGAEDEARAGWLLAGPRGPSRTLWCQLPEVARSGVLDTLSANQKRLQEAKFELVTSEASYLNSLAVLESHFICHPAFRDQAVLSSEDRRVLFDTILPVRKCSQQLMKQLERCWKEGPLLPGLCELVRRHAEQHFHVYVAYCENQVYLVKTLQRLKSSAQFSEALSSLETHPACQSLSLHSFLMLPMQRVTRLPLLLDAVLRHLEPEDSEYQSCMDALATLNSFVSQCNEGARNMERIEEMSRLAACIEFPPHMSGAPELAPSCVRGENKPTRWLVRSGELTQLVWRGDEQLKLTFGKKFQKVPLWLFLFTDLLVITKKKSEESYSVVDYCQRSLVEISSGDVMTQLHMKETPGKHVALLTLLENRENKTVEMLMSCASETDWSRWREALSPPAGAGGESVYAGWDCPQVAALHAHRPAQPDELALDEGDIVNVIRKMPEGWYYGSRLRDGEAGWFPGSYTVEVASPHVRARNLRQRYRLLALSGSYLGQRRKT